MLAPKRSKFRKQQKGRTRGRAKGGDAVSFGTFGLQALEPGWLMHALDLALSPLCRGSRIAFRVGDEEASLVDCTATPGIAEDYDVLVETDATGFYYLVVDRKLEGVRVEGDVTALEQLLDGFAASPLPA